MTRTWAPRRAVALAGAVVVAAFALLVVPRGAIGSAPACASPAIHAPAGQLVVPVVIDSSSTVEVNCVQVPMGSTGAQVLAIRAQLLGKPPPRYNDTGLLCAIDGYPATGCGVEHGGHYAYWAYFHGGASWTYANSGPAFWQVFPGDVEGWRFEPDGSANPSDPPPRAASSAAVLCPSATTTTLAPPTSTTPATTVRHNRPSTSRSGSARPAATARASSTTASAATNAPAATAKRTTPSTGNEPRATTPPATTAGTPSASQVVAANATGTTRDGAVEARPAGSSGLGSGGVVKLALVVGLIAVLAAGATVRARRRSRG